jgi:hypothetical protein
VKRKMPGSRYRAQPAGVAPPWRVLARDGINERIRFNTALQVRQNGEKFP